jgi:hypothetical protein
MRMTEEKRRFTRICPATAGQLEIAGKVFSGVRLSDLSIGGCKIEIDEDVPEGAGCLVTIPLAHMGPGIMVDGLVVRVEEQEISIKFTRVSPEDLNHLQNMIRYNAADPERIEDEIKNHPGLV